MRKVFSLCTIFGIAACIGLISCNKQPVVDSCPVLYSIDTEHEYALQSKWQFVGFENVKTGAIESPICGEVESWISFTQDGTTSKGGSADRYTQVFEGVVLINHFRGTYEQNSNGELLVSPTVNTTVRGTEQVKRFESKFHHLLQQVNGYEVTYNELVLTPEYGDIVLRFVAD